MARVLLEKIRKNYGDFEAVKGIDLEIHDGEFVVLVGPSGCGKSTTLRMIAGLEEISGGSLYIGDRLVNDVPPKDRDIAMVFQNYALYPHMNVWENMAFGLKLRKLPKEEIEKRINEAAKILGLENQLTKKPGQLSGGQRQRVALGRAIVREPKVFLMDEPLSNLDAKLRVQMRTEISKLSQRLGVTVVYVTHDQTEAMTMGDRIVVMKDGIIQQVGTPEEVYHSPDNLFVAGFIGSPAMNFIKGKIAKNASGVFFVAEPGIKLELTEKQAETMVNKGFADKEIILGVRPEFFTVKPADNKINAVLDVVENMGSEYYVYFSNLANQDIVARLQFEKTPHTGEKLELGVVMERVHFFDPATEKVIR
ncbi:MAG: sn-glycerol-3-phosphate ABC transporter ATP-binding protein UgpC [Clostridia bacterium]|nr:sn-glycerol-3-phosphate ABC transporter ATP-binding protein UgpC [Clostridia bacterium]